MRFPRARGPGHVSGMVLLANGQARLDFRCEDHEPLRILLNGLSVSIS